MKKESVPEFDSICCDNVFAETDLTIKLEKKLHKNKEWPHSIETAQGTRRSPNYTQDFEPMEDPFAGNEKDIPIMTDPLEGYNRWMFGVNESLYQAVLEPIATGYRDKVHEHLRIGIKNIFSNALAPVKFMSSLLQLEFKKSGRVLVRALINTTLGLGGYADIAGQEYGIKSVNEDFDQALGSFGVPSGPYVVLPFFGPSTVRNIIGRTADAFLSPPTMSGVSYVTNAGIAVEDNVNAASFILDDKKQLEASALDEYESVRDFYHQYRYGLLKK